MRYSPLLRLSAETAPMKIISQESKTVLGKKYNYAIRKATILDDLHGYGWWAIKNKFHDLWPLVGAMGAWAVFASYMIWWTCQKTEIQFNRFSEHKPWDWERAQHTYDKRKKAFKNDSFMWQRIPELDKLQAEMLAAKMERLAAERAARKHHKQEHH